MNSLSFTEVEQWVNSSIDTFHQARIKSLEKLTLQDLLKKNPYLQKAKNVTTGNDMIVGALDAKLSSSEEELFGVFLEDLAIFIAEKTCGGHKSAAEGIDLEFINNGIYYVVSIKSGTNWGNGDQQTKLEQNFATAEKRVRQSKRDIRIQSILGICYGKVRTALVRGAYKIVGQNFWFFISGDKDLYKKLIEPIGYKAKEHNEGYFKSKDQKINQLTKEFLLNYTLNGIIDWEKLVEFNAGNFDLDKYFKID
jgi:hypothetical protein